MFAKNIEIDTVQKSDEFSRRACFQQAYTKEIVSINPCVAGVVSDHDQSQPVAAPALELNSNKISRYL